jgi:hypothetical protein
MMSISFLPFASLSWAGKTHFSSPPDGILARGKKKESLSLSLSLKPTSSQTDLQKP